MRSKYYFGTLIKQIDVFAFPRTGSHFLNYCCQGLFDLVSLPHDQLDNAEAIARQSELNEEPLYALDLREPSVPFQPVWINPLATGMHGVPGKGQSPALLLIREPLATVYSLFRVGPRWGQQHQLTDSWIQTQLDHYAHFYTEGWKMLEAFPEETMLIRYEELVAGPEVLEKLVQFAGLKPKLKPWFVHNVTRFQNMARPGARTFYSEANNAAWRSDSAWMECLERVSRVSFPEFGYAGDR
jgi:hypothetical protein